MSRNVFPPGAFLKSMNVLEALDVGGLKTKKETVN
jgi:hypothetical protein